MVINKTKNRKASFCLVFPLIKTLYSDVSISDVHRIIASNREYKGTKMINGT